MSPENSPDQPLGSVAPEVPVAENSWAAGPIEAVLAEVVASNGIHTEVMPAEVTPVEVSPETTEGSSLPRRSSRAAPYPNG